VQEFCRYPIFILALFLFLPYRHPANDERFTQASKAIVSGESHWRKLLGKRNMNAAGQIAVTLAALIGFSRLFLAYEGDSHRLSGLLILAGLVGKVALSI
jgi:hypothetical protein